MSLDISSSHEVLSLLVEMLLQELETVCPVARGQIMEASENGIILYVNGIHIVCAGHNKELTTNSLFVTINMVPILIKDDEDTISYIKRVASIVVEQLNWQVLIALFQKLPPFYRMGIIRAKNKIQVGVESPTLNGVRAFYGVVTIENGKSDEWRGSPEFCVPWVQPHTDPALEAQLMMIASDVSNFTITIKPINGGYASVHDYDGIGSMLVLSSSSHVQKYRFKSTTARLSLDHSNKYLVVLKTTNTLFDGEIELMILLTSTKIYVRSGEYPIEQYKLLDELLHDVGIDFGIHIKP